MARENLLLGFAEWILVLGGIVQLSWAAPSMHPDIWNHDGMQGGSLLGMHDYNGEHQQARKPGEQSFGVTNPPPVRAREQGRRTVLVGIPTGTTTTDAGELDKTTGGDGGGVSLTAAADLPFPDSELFLVHGDNLNFGPAYENTVNPFLSHLEQGWKLKPVRHRYMRKKILANAHLSPQQQQKMGQGSSVADDLFGPLPEDPEKEHFMDSGEEADAEAEENRAFGNEEKDLGDLFSVLFSPDY